MSKILRSQNEKNAHARMFYAETNVYKNKFGIRDENILEQIEREITARRAIHRHLFRDIYNWAGKVRTYTTGRGIVPFATPDSIEIWMNEQFVKLKSNNYLLGLDIGQFSMAAAEAVNEINAGHPFPDGSECHHFPSGDWKR
ncbi:MAG: Fic family protein, partial [Pseudomonadota bacterium]